MKAFGLVILQLVLKRQTLHLVLRDYKTPRYGVSMLDHHSTEFSKINRETLKKGRSN
jgi:hypothetical protein